MAHIDIYTTRFCGYCRAAKALLTRKGLAFTEIDVSGDAEARSRMMERAGGRYTVPQVFIGSTHVGGADELHALDCAGALDAVLHAEGIAPAVTESELSA
jgi:glutaredoxin 3